MNEYEKELESMALDKIYKGLVKRSSPMEVSCPLVGMHFRPPAKALLASLPSGAPLELRLEPENPYDPNAIMVWVSASAIPTSQHLALRGALIPFGFDLEQVLETGRWHLGYIKRDYAEDLAPRLALTQVAPGDCYAAKLSFASGGAPLVVVDLEHVTVPSSES